MSIYRLHLARFFFLTFCFLSFTQLWAQRLVLNPVQSTNSVSTTSHLPVSPDLSEKEQVLKIYPDGTKKLVPLSALNFHDDGATYGGPPKVVPFDPNSDLGKQTAGGISLAPVGSTDSPAYLGGTIPQSPQPSQSLTSAGDPMGGGGNPMGGSAPIDPLAGSPIKNAGPLQTVSGKPAPLVGDAASAQLGEWESFFVNAGIGGSLQNELTATRIWNGSNRQAYPYAVNGTIGNLSIDGDITGEKFSFQPGFRFDTEFGYNFYEWLGVSLQTGIIYNGLQNYMVSANGQLTLSGYGTLVGSGDFKFPADGDLVQVPVQINGIFRWPGNVPLRPFLGLGVGTVWQQLNVVSVDAGPVSFAGDYVRSAFQFGWNAQLGLTYTVEPGIDFYSAFKMLSSVTPVIGNYEFQSSYNFSFEVGIQSRF